jgi:integrase
MKKKRIKGKILTKYGLTNKDLISRILKKAEKHSSFANQTIKILYWTGMHPSSLLKIRIDSIYSNTLTWRRPKTDKVLSAELNDGQIEVVKAFCLRKRKYSRSYLNQVIKEVGNKAGIKGLSPMTFRHTKCLELIQKYYKDPFMVQILMQKLGVSEAVLWKNYAQLKEVDMI